MKRGVTMLVLMAAMGCGGGDQFAASRSPLKVGDELLTHYDKTYGVPGNDDPTQVQIGLPGGQGIVGAGFDFVPVGTKVRVTGDPEAAGGKFDRKVEVLVLEGKLKGSVGKIARERLRAPAR